ncbi:YeaC family protein [Haliea sp. E17]
MIASMTPEIYRSLRRAIEIGKWPDGNPVSPEQREHAMRAVIAWGQENLPVEERVGYIDRGHKAGEVCDDPQETPLSWK